MVSVKLLDISNGQTLLGIVLPSFVASPNAMWDMDWFLAGSLHRFFIYLAYHSGGRRHPALVWSLHLPIQLIESILSA